MAKYDKNNFINRELSWMDFNLRVLDETLDDNNPLFEKLKFLSITASNLDEFLSVRCSSLIDQINASLNKKDFAGLTPLKQYELLVPKIKEFIYSQYNIWDTDLRLKLDEIGIKFLKHHEELSNMQKVKANEYFRKEVYPVLTPMAVDSSRPFPLISSLSINIGAIVAKSDNVEFVTVELPKCLPRVLVFESDDKTELDIILLEEIIEMNMSSLFEKYDIICAHPYRITRNADLNINEDDASDLLKEIEDQVRKRKWGEVIRLEVERHMDERLVSFLLTNLQVKEDRLIEIGGAIDLTFLNEIYSIEGFDKFKFKKFIPQVNPNVKPDKDIFKAISKQDILLSHPYESFDPIVKLIVDAATDDNVLAIKQTLYRVSGKSPIIYALEKAALNGKQVTVLVELKARFDEEHNILWARKLEQAGAHVIYGLKGLKTHSKITLIVRKENGLIKRYVHLGTGNYNDTTAKLYTDLGLLTCNESIGEDATALFNMMSGYSEPLHWNSLIVAPLLLRNRIEELIDREIDNAKSGKKAKIIMKMNSLCDKKMIEKLYDASIAGVEINLLVRGICSLKANIKEVSDNIKVYSLVGRYLEHSRIYYFYNDGKENVFLSSADLMPRNLNRRVEIMFPIYDAKIKTKLLEHIDILFSDNTKLRYMDSDGLYKHVDTNDNLKVNAQEAFMKLAIKKAPKANPKNKKIVPLKSS